MTNGPLSLPEAVRLAVSRHPSVEASRAAARAAHAQVRAMRSSQRLGITAANYLTDGDAPLGFTAPSPTLPVGVNAATPFNYGYTMPSVPHYGQNVMFMLPLYNGGRGRAELKSAVAARQAAESQTASTEQEVALHTKEAYYAVLRAQQILEARERQMKEIEGHLAEIEARHKKDGVALYEVLRHRAELAHARQEHTGARRDLTIARLDLKMMLGLPLDQEVTLSDTLAFRSFDSTLQEQLAVAQRQSPELAAAEARCKSADEALNAAKRASRPNVYACLVQANAANSGARGLNGHVGGIMTYLPLFDSGMRRAAREAAEATVIEQKSTCEDMKLKVQRDVAAAWATLDAASESVRLSEASAAQAEESYNAIQLRYEARRATQTELLDALAAVTRARLDRVQALYDYNVAIARLDRAVGRV
jgi:outer membrane protein TolC